MQSLKYVLAVTAGVLLTVFLFSFNSSKSDQQEIEVAVVEINVNAHYRIMISKPGVAAEVIPLRTTYKEEDRKANGEAIAQAFKNLYNEGYVIQGVSNSNNFERYILKK